MAKKSEKTYEFFKPREFSKAYPTRAKVVDDDVLSKYVSWVLIDRSEVARGRTYLLMTSSMYNKACYRFAPMTEDFHRNARQEIDAPLLQQKAIVAKCQATITALHAELAKYEENRKVFEKNQSLASQELAAVLLLKRKLQQLIENLKLGDSENLSSIRGF